MNQTSSRHNMFYLNGWLAAAMLAGAAVLIAMALFSTVGVLAAPLLVFVVLAASGFRIVQPNTALVSTCFGRYSGILSESGFFWIIPLIYQTQSVSLRSGNYVTPTLKVNDGDVLKAGTTLATWDPHTHPMITEYAGRVEFENVEEGVTVTRQTDPITGLSTMVVIDGKRRNSASKLLRPTVKLLDENGEPVKIPGTETPVTLAFQVGAIIQVREGQEVGKGDVLARIPQASTKTRDITGGLPRVAELFEARIPKDAGMLAEVTGTVSFGKETKGKQRLVITDLDGVAYETLISKDKQILVHDGQVVNKGETVVDGAVDPHDILRLKGIEELTRYIVQEVQEVYRLQGVKISDKHIEVIIRQMLRRVNIVDAGDTNFITGEQVERAEVMMANEQALAEGKEPARFENVLLGITKASLSTDSFISAASFQETTRVLTEAAIMGRKDDLRGLKENVIVGRLIPAGTGLSYHRSRRAAWAAQRTAARAMEAEADIAAFADNEAADASAENTEA